MSQPTPVIIVPGFYGYAVDSEELGESSSPAQVLTSLWLSLVDGREDRPATYQIAVPGEAVLSAEIPPDPALEAAALALPVHAAADALYCFVYDWRRDLTASAARLASEIVELGVDEVDLMASGPGCLVARYLVESGAFAHAAPKVRRMVLLGAPNWGVPAGLILLHGVFNVFDSTTAMSDILTSFPASIQLLPPRGVSYVYLDGEPGVRIEPFAWPEAFFGEGEDDARFSPDLAKDLVARSEGLHERLTGSFDPSWRRVLTFASTSEPTHSDLHLELVGGRVEWRHAGREAGAGDGVVPIWSALPQASTRSFLTRGSGASFFADERTKSRIQAFLRGSLS